MDNHLFIHSWPQLLFIIGTILLVSLLLYYTFPFGSKYAIINAKSRLEFLGTKARKQYVSDAKSLIESGFAKVCSSNLLKICQLMVYSLQQSSLFKLVGDSDTLLILSPKYANEIRSHPFLSFTKALITETHPYIKGFEPMMQIILPSEIFQVATRTRMTRALGR
jgi:hypothetical protein